MQHIPCPVARTHVYEGRSARCLKFLAPEPVRLCMKWSTLTIDIRTRSQQAAELVNIPARTWLCTSKVVFR
jgi:hypothetical protein